MIGTKLGFLRVNYSSHWVALIWLFLITILWYVMADGGLTFLVVLWFFSLFFSSFMVGDLILKSILMDDSKFNNLPNILLTGLLFINVILLFIFFVFPFSLAVDWIILFSFVLFFWLRSRASNLNALLTSSHLSEAIFFLISPLIITVWCRDILHPIELSSKFAIIRSWPDIYFHLCQISSFASSSGIQSISDVQMVGATPHLYHVGSYILPAVMVSLFKCSSLVAFASLLVPLGILVSALAAFSLGSAIFGRWPGLAAGLALILLPDAYQQGFGNAFFSYHWLQQIGPAQGYALAGAACGFLFILQACLTNQYRLLFLGYGFIVVTLLYKAQIFVAISFLALQLPILFMGKRLFKHRAILLLASSFIYIVVVMLSQLFPSIPVIRYDGSSLSEYSSTVLNMQSLGIKRIFTLLIAAEENNWYLRVVSFALMLLIVTFGVFPLLYASLIKHLKRSFSSVVWTFPLMVIVIYLVMSIFLALDNRHIGSPEELLHRPFVWAYFVIVVWSIAATYHRFFGDALPATSSNKLKLIILTLVLMVVPITFGKRIQALNRGGYQELPLCQLEASQFIRENSSDDEVVQDAKNDPHFIISALSERRPFAIDSNNVRAPKAIQPRLQSLQRLRELKDSNEVESFMKDNLIKWYVVNPTDNISWAKGMLDHVVFECGGYRVYHF